MLLIATVGAAVAALLSSQGCLAPRDDFGEPCVVEGTECGDGATICVDGSCVPRRIAGALGEGCALPWQLKPTDDDSEPLRLGVATTDVGAAENDLPSCQDGEAGVPDLVFALSLREPMPVRVRARAATSVRLSVRPLSEGTCGAPVRDGCTQGSQGAELVLARLDAGEWAVIVELTGSTSRARADIVEVIAERLDCRLDSLPDGELACAGFRSVDPLEVPRIDAAVARLDDGRVFIGGGLGAGDERLASAEIYDPVAETFSFVSQTSNWPFVGSSIAPLGGYWILFGGNLLGEPLSFRPGLRGPDRLAEASTTGSQDDLFGRVHAFPLSDGAVLVLPEDNRPLTAELLAAACWRNEDCNSDQLCLRPPDAGITIDGICLCVREPCEPAPQASVSLVSFLAEAPPATLARPFAAAAFTRAIGDEGIFAHGGRAAVLDLRSRRWRPVAARERRDVTLTRLGEADVLISGGTVDGRPSDVVAVFSGVSEQVLEASWRLPSSRFGHSATSLADGRVLIAGGVASDGSLLDDAFLLDVRDGALSMLPRLPEPRAHHAAVLLQDGSVLLTAGQSVGGLAEGSVLFERLPRMAAPAPPPVDAELSCGGIEQLELDGEWHLFSTLGRRDRLRSRTCPSMVSDGVELPLSLHVPEPSSLHLDVVTLSQGDVVPVAIWAFRGDCLNRHDVGCQGDYLEEASLDLLEVQGDLVVVVETPDDLARHETIEGVDFRIRATLAPVATCEPGPEDPADDDALAARPLTEDDSVPSDGSGNGTLCAGDVDHLLIPSTGRSKVSLWGTPYGSASLLPLLIDESASLAAGGPVFGGVGQPFSFGRYALQDHPPGYFALAIASPDDSPLRLSYDVLHEPNSCAPDPGDSLVPILDDATRAVARRALSPGTNVRFCIAWEGDTDVLVIEPTSSEDLIIAADTSEAIIELFALASDDSLGALVPSTQAGDEPAWVVLAADLPQRLALRVGGDVGLDGELAANHGAGDTCANPVVLAGAGTRSVSANGFHNTMSANERGNCTGYSSYGTDVFFALELPTGATLQATLAPEANDDVALYLLGSCSSSCLLGDDSDGDGASESLTFTNSGPTATYILVADSYYSGAWAGQLTWSVATP